MLIPIILLVLMVMLPIAIGIYVYRDAKNRSMNAALWTLVAIFAPGFIGLIIYLVVRSEHSALHCPQCSAPVQERFAVCPRCGVPLKDHCRKCDFPLEQDWSVCPNCGEPISPEQRESMSVRAKTDTGIKKLLALVIIAPTLFCILLVVGVSAYSAGGVSQSVSATMSLDDPSLENQQIRSWIDGCDGAGEGIYVLKAVSKEGDAVQTQYLIYRNDGHYDVDASISMGGWLSKSRVTIRFRDGEEAQDYSLFYYECTGDKEIDIRIRQFNRSVKFRMETAEAIPLP